MNRLPWKKITLALLAAIFVGLVWYVSGGFFAGIVALGLGVAGLIYAESGEDWRL